MAGLSRGREGEGGVMTLGGEEKKRKKMRVRMKSEPGLTMERSFGVSAWVEEGAGGGGGGGGGGEKGGRN